MKTLTFLFPIICMLLMVAMVEPISWWHHNAAIRGSVPFNFALTEALKQKKTSVPLQEINPSEWQCACVLKEYHTVEQSLKTCLRVKLAESGLMEGINVDQITVHPENFTAKEGGSGIIFLNGNNATIVLPDPPLFDADVWPCHPRDKATLTTQSIDGKLYINLKQHK